MSVFGALNRFISRLDGDPQGQQASRIQGAFGFQVLRNTNTELPVEPWFDFIIGINGRQIDNGDSNLFATEVRNCAGNSITLGLWSAKGQAVRTVYAQIPADGSSLGLSLQWTPLTSTEEVWHVLDVAANSPADLAGLLPYGDYIIGSPEGALKGESGFGELVEHFMDRPMRIYVYNHEYNVTRLVELTPSRNWGGTGALGCVLGYGALHRIPASLEEPPQAPGETLFETQNSDAPLDEKAGDSLQQGAQYLIPADLAAPPPGGGPPIGTAQARAAAPKKGRANNSTSKAGDMDAYFAEGEAKSREVDHAPSPKPGAGGLAPPPKGPPRASSPLKGAESEKSAEDTEAS